MSIMNGILNIRSNCFPNQSLLKNHTFFEENAKKTTQFYAFPFFHSLSYNYTDLFLK